jgi:DNA-binding transcriptional MerR regulator
LTERFQIGELARRSGRSEHTIRWYERQGLIPNVGRDRGGRRVYETGHLEHLVFLEWLRLTGMSVADMRRFTALALRGWRTLKERQAMLDAHRAEVEARMADLSVALDLIEAKMAYFDEWNKRKKRPAPVPLPDFAERHSQSRSRRRTVKTANRTKVSAEAE